MKKTRKTPESILPESLMAEMLAALPARANMPTAKRRTAMKQSLLSRVQATAKEDAEIGAAEMRIVRSNEGKWFSFAPNVEMKVLNDDGDTRTWLARFQAGGCIPAHRQSGDEEAIVLEGWCHVGEHVMRKGDYQLILKGARHGEIVSPEGCLIFVRSHSAKRSAAELSQGR